MIGDRIKELREQYGMTQTALAKKLGLSRSAINAWEMGISIPSTQYVVELAMLFRVSSDFLLELHRTESIDVTGLNRDERPCFMACWIISIVTTTHWNCWMGNLSPQLHPNPPAGRGGGLSSRLCKFFLRFQRRKPPGLLYSPAPCLKGKKSSRLSLRLSRELFLPFGCCPHIESIKLHRFPWFFKF